MDKLRLRNYRCLEDTGKVELRPITILLGANSSGKSSFIKFFPLLQQSIGTTVNGLFLWDGQYVDFKNFKNTVKDGHDEIVVDYQIENLNVSQLFSRKKQALKDVCVSMKLAAKDDYYDYLKEVQIAYDKIVVVYSFDSNNNSCHIWVNDFDSRTFRKERIEAENDNNLLPTLRFTFDGGHLQMSGGSSPSASKETRLFRGLDGDDMISFFTADEELRDSSMLWDSIWQSFKNQRPDATDEEIKRMSNIRIYQLSGRLLSAVNSYFYKIASKFSYVLPLRSIMDRYYRFQNRDVDQIDPDGDNLAMFLNSLPENRFREYNKWISDIFHFTIKLQKSEGHVELLIVEGGKGERNLVDVGFGYTQILPILTIIWKAIYGKRTATNKDTEDAPITIAIEQPELHLHPRFQAFFAVMLAKVMDFCHKSRVRIRIIIETHSEVIVNKLGQLIETANLGITTNDVNIVLFNATHEGLAEYVHATEFDSNGYLKEWPFGFFSDEDVH